MLRGAAPGTLIGLLKPVLAATADVVGVAADSVPTDTVLLSVGHTILES